MSNEQTWNQLPDDVFIPPPPSGEPELPWWAEAWALGFEEGRHYGNLEILHLVKRYG
jgi:hypothetical protein